MIIVPDASAAVEYLLRTEMGQVAGALFATGDLAAPELLDAEVLAAVRGAVLGGHLRPARGRQAVEDLAAWPVTRYAHRPLLRAAWELRHNLSAYDALYVALAMGLGAEIVTADASLARAPVPVTVRNLRG